MAAPGAIDPTKPAKYPIILSDALLGKSSSKETYTGIRYNHRPTLSTDNAPAQARLKKSARDGSYNLGFDDNGDRYQYQGVRTTDDGNCVLIFDPARKAFVLHRVDSMFHMNITRMPTDSNVESLRKQFPQLEVKSGSSSKAQQKGKDAPSKTAPAKAPASAKGKGKETKSTPAKEPMVAKGKKVAKPAEKEKPKPIELALPTVNKSITPPMPTLPMPQVKAPAAEPAPEKRKQRSRSPIESEESEVDDDDIGLTIEYPDGNPSSYRSSFQPSNNFSPTFPQRRFSEFVRDADNEDDADGEIGYDPEEDDDDDAEEFMDVPMNRGPTGYRPVSPVVNNPVEAPERFVFEPAEVEVDDELEMDLEAELERELMNAEAEAAGADSDSSMSEEE
ncbi:hypothetical protein OQA88_7290 [Cercophora sp. LCS_1]